MDGSSDVDVNVSVGTIFFIYPPRYACWHAGNGRISSSLVTNELRQVTWYTALFYAGLHHRMRCSRLSC
ncbi:hypothetical protein ACNKHN_24085 [Shigella flexneri]